MSVPVSTRQANGRWMKPVKPNRTHPSGTDALVIYRPLVEKIVAALGALVTHQIAYPLASLLGVGSSSVTDHGHLSLQWAIVAPLAVGSVSAFVVWQLRSLGFRSGVSARQLGLLVVLFFLIQESIEGLASGISFGQVLTHPAILTGIFLGPIIGWIMSRVLAGVTELAARWMARPSFSPPIATGQPVPIPVRYRSALRNTPSRPRAPPSSLR